MCIKKKISTKPNDSLANNNTSIKKSKHADKPSSRKLSKKPRSFTDSSDEAKDVLPSPRKGKQKAKNVKQIVRLASKAKSKKVSRIAESNETLSQPPKVESAKKQSARRLKAETETKLSCNVNSTKWNLENFKKSKESEFDLTSETFSESSAHEEPASKKRRAKLKTNTKCSFKSSTVDNTSTRRRTKQQNVTDRDTSSFLAKQKLQQSTHRKQLGKKVIAKTTNKRGFRPNHKARLSKELSSDDDDNDSVEEEETDTEDDDQIYKLPRNSVKEVLLKRKDSYHLNKNKRKINLSTEESSNDADEEDDNDIQCSPVKERFQFKTKNFLNDSKESSEDSFDDDAEDNNVQCSSYKAGRKFTKQTRDESKTVSVIEKRASQTLRLNSSKNKQRIKYRINLHKLKPGRSKLALTFDSDEISSESDMDGAIEKATFPVTDSDADSETELRKSNALDKDNSSDVLSLDSETDIDSSDDCKNHSDLISDDNVEEVDDVNSTNKYIENLEDDKSYSDSGASSACSIPTSKNKQSNKPNEFLTDFEISNEDVLERNVSDELMNSSITAELKSPEENSCSTSSQMQCGQSDKISLQDLENKGDGFNNNAEPTVYAFKLHAELLEEVKIGLNETIYGNMLEDSIEDNIIFVDSTTDITNNDIFEESNVKVDTPIISTMPDVNQDSLNSCFEVKNNVEAQEELSCLLRFINNEFDLSNKDVQCLSSTNNLLENEVTLIQDKIEANNDFLTNHMTFMNKVAQETAKDLNSNNNQRNLQESNCCVIVSERDTNKNSINIVSDSSLALLCSNNNNSINETHNNKVVQNDKGISLDVNSMHVTDSMELTAQDSFDFDESPRDEIKLHWSDSEDSDFELENNKKVINSKGSIGGIVKDGPLSESIIDEEDVGVTTKDFQCSNSIVLEAGQVRNAQAFHTITSNCSNAEDTDADWETEREDGQFTEDNISSNMLTLVETIGFTKLDDGKDTQHGVAMYDLKASVMNQKANLYSEEAGNVSDELKNSPHDSTDTYRILANEINTMQINCVELLNENLEHERAESFSDEDVINTNQMANETEERELGDGLNFGTDLTCSIDNTAKFIEDGILAKDTDEQEEGEILSSSSEFNDGFDEDFIGDINDRQWLNQLTERERENVIFKRLQQRENMHKRWEIRQKLQQRQNYQDYNKERSQKRKASMEKRRSNDQRSNAMAKLIEQRNDKYKRAEEECERMHEAAEEHEELPSVVCKRKPSVKLKASEIYSDDSGSSCSSSDESSSNSSVASLKDADESTDKQHAESSLVRPEAINISTVAELNQMRISRNELARIAYCPIFKQTVQNCFVRIYIGTHMGKPVHRIAEVVDTLERVTVYKLESTISNCYLRLKHGAQNRAYPMDKISNQAFTDSEYRMWQTSCAKDDVPQPTLAQLTEKAKHLKAALHYEMTEDDISQMIEKKNKLRKWPVNVSLHKACLLKERDAAKLNGDIEHAKILDDRLQEINAQESHKPMQDSCIMNYINQRSRLINMNDKCDSACPQANDPFTRRSTKPCIVASSKRRAVKETMTTKTPTVEAPPPLPLPPPPPLPVLVETTQVKRPPSRKEVAERAFRAMARPKRAVVMHMAPTNINRVTDTGLLPQITVDEPTNEPSNMKRITLADYWKKRTG